jgi:post-segregation antitoxin (ccd killing protein)
MTRQSDFEIADVPNPKSTREINRKKIEILIPIYEEEYVKLNIDITSVSNPTSNLPVEITNSSIKTFRHWLRDSDYADFAQYTNINASAFNARAVSKAIPKSKGRPWKETNGTEMKVYIGILLYISVYPVGSAECAAYWDRNSKTPYHPVVFNAISSNRFH